MKWLSVTANHNYSVTSIDSHTLKKAYNIVFFALAICLIPAFILWVHRQERLRRPALIPNSLWKEALFTTTCVTVFFTWAVFNSLQYFSALYFERIDKLSTLATAVRLLPMVVVGAATNVVGLLYFLPLAVLS